MQTLFVPSDPCYFDPLACALMYYADKLDLEQLYGYAIKLRLTFKLLR